MRVPYTITQGKLSTRPGESNPPLSQPRHSFRPTWGIPDSVIRVAFGIWIPGNLCCWNPEYSSKRAESHSTIGNQYPSSTDKESGIQSLESRIHYFLAGSLGSRMYQQPYRWFLESSMNLDWTMVLNFAKAITPLIIFSKKMSNNWWFRVLSYTIHSFHE